MRAARFQALEVKNTDQIRPSDLCELRAFGEDFPEATRWLIYRWKERFLRGGVICTPASSFARCASARFHVERGVTRRVV